MTRSLICASLVMLGAFGISEASRWKLDDPRLDAYFRHQVEEITRHPLTRISTLEEWTSRKGELRRQLWEMLGLWPVPERTDLQPIVTGTVERPDFVVERLHFQSLPGLYVTGNLYRPREADRPLPAILYVCGHGNVEKDGVSFGSKAHYQHHPAWFARHGYVALVIDTLQLGEIRGLHHGMYREGRWWWLNRGYTPAGVEAWNSIRAVDYLSSRPEVDAARIGVTGRSGGGAYSWFLAALDERIQAAVPVAGITDLQDHVVNGVIEGHCDCMYFLNTYRWDFPVLAALIAPRPLLIANTDKDPIFPLEGVMRIHEQVRHIYTLYEAQDRLGLLITEGGHADTQDLQVPAFRWMNRWLKDDNSAISAPAVRLLEPEEIKVFASLPFDQINTQIDELFVKTPFETASELIPMLREKVLQGWPSQAIEPELTTQLEIEDGGRVFRVLEVGSQPFASFHIILVQGRSERSFSNLTVRVLAEDAWQRIRTRLPAALVDFLPNPSVFEAEASPSEAAGPAAAEPGPDPISLGSEEALALVFPRGVGPSGWKSQDPRRETHIRRRFALIGQSLGGMQVWDVLQALRALSQASELRDLPIRLQAQPEMAIVAMLAALFEKRVKELRLVDLPDSFMDGPAFLNLERVVDVPRLLEALSDRITMESVGARN